VSGGSSGPSPASSSAQQQPDRRIAPTARLAEAAPSSSPSASLSTSSEGSLWTFLVRRALQSSDPVLANNLYWYLTVETEDKRWGKFFKTIKARFLEQMLEVS
jgi:phosphatidylinositol 3-kinase